MDASRRNRQTHRRPRSSGQAVVAASPRRPAQPRPGQQVRAICLIRTPGTVWFGLGEPLPRPAARALFPRPQLRSQLRPRSHILIQSSVSRWPWTIDPRRSPSCQLLHLPRRHRRLPCPHPMPSDASVLALHQRRRRHRLGHLRIRHGHRARGGRAPWGALCLYSWTPRQDCSGQAFHARLSAVKEAWIADWGCGV